MSAEIQREKSYSLYFQSELRVYYHPPDRSSTYVFLLLHNEVVVLYTINRCQCVACICWISSVLHECQSLCPCYVTFLLSHFLSGILQQTDGYPQRTKPSPYVKMSDVLAAEHIIQRAKYVLVVGVCHIF